MDKSAQKEFEQSARSFGQKLSLDFRLENHGSICFLRPLNRSAVEWVNERIGADHGYQPKWPTVLIEPRYLVPILEGVAADGLSVRLTSEATSQQCLQTEGR
jgi:hypothetical protein